MKLCFIGFGAMAKAIARGLAKNPLFDLHASAPSLSRGINQQGIHTDFDNRIAIKSAQIIILAVKPAQMGLVVEEIKNDIPKGCLIISVAAGLGSQWFMQRINTSNTFIRAMPNLPAEIGYGATPLYATTQLCSTEKELVELIFSSIGLLHWVDDEQDIDSFTALSGSGPAYVFLFIESVIEAARSLGLEESTAKRFAIQTFKGAVLLAEQKESLSELRKGVTSPGGTTAAALSVLQGHLEKLILRAMKAAQKRSQELGKIN